MPGSTTTGSTTAGSTSITRPRSAAVSAVHEVANSRLLLAIALVSGSVLRLWQINAMGYNTDEAVYAGQAAAIAGVAGLKDIFPIFRAHPLLIQFVLALIYKIQFSDLAGRLLAVAIGLGTVYLTYLAGKTLYGRLPGAVAALFLALMPYHVTVSRQFLLDGPMVFFGTLTAGSYAENSTYAPIASSISSARHASAEKPGGRRNPRLKEAMSRMPSLAELIMRRDGDKRAKAPAGRLAFAFALASITVCQNATAVSLAFC